MNDDVTVSVRADTTEFTRSLNELKQLSADFGRELTGTMKAAAVGGRELDDVLRRLALNLAGMALGQGLKPLQGLASALFSKAMGGILPFANGGVVPFARGGVVGQPTLFPLGGGLGLMGEAGAEAIMPLARGPDGRLGVAATDRAAPVSITFNVSAPDPAAFAKSEAQVSAMLARAVSRGLRTL